VLFRSTLSDAELAETIRADGVDILFDLSGHTRHNRLLVFARKPAPLQVTAIGYPHTTGLAAMDYRISDRFRMPPALAAQNVEHVALIPCSGTFEHGPAPEVNALPALHSGVFTFGSFQRTQKIGPASLALWGQVLRALPQARMLIGAVENAAARRRLTDALAEQGVAAERLTFHPPMKLADYLALHHRIDMLLDTTPYPGGTTTHHGLWMGVPTLTRTGESLVSWQGAANLLRLGLDEFVAHDDAQFVQLAQRWAADLPGLARLRLGLREHIAQHPRVQPAFVARGMQAALRTMWRRWCAGLPAASFEVTV
jgi:predicted O-linked N-acetylglucosamine transferase (SPINDLY family)